MAIFGSGHRVLGSDRSSYTSRLGLCDALLVLALFPVSSVFPTYRPNLELHDRVPGPLGRRAVDCTIFSASPSSILPRLARKAEEFGLRRSAPFSEPPTPWLSAGESPVLALYGSSFRPRLTHFGQVSFPKSVKCATKPAFPARKEVGSITSVAWFCDDQCGFSTAARPASRKVSSRRCSELCAAVSRTVITARISCGLVGFGALLTTASRIAS